MLAEKAEEEELARALEASKHTPQDDHYLQLGLIAELSLLVAAPLQ